MTLIVGVKCSDGIVMGADGAATYGSLGMQTIRQPVRKKLRVIAESIVIGVSGPVGLGQRLATTVESLFKAGNLYQIPGTNLYRHPHELMDHLRLSFWGIIDREIQIARAASQIIQLNLTIADALSSTLLATPVPSFPTPSLFVFDQQASPEEATEDLPFFAIGSGQLIADPFLAFMRRLYWPDRLPTVAEGTLAVYWTLHHAIATHPGGVADPKQVVVIEKQKGQWRPRELTQGEAEEHLEHVSMLEKCLTDFDKNDQRALPPSPPSITPASK